MDVLAFLETANAQRRDRELRSMSDIVLLAYHERVTTNIIQTPENEREVMALFDQGELQATEAEMAKRGMHAKTTPPLSTRWRVPRTSIKQENNDT